MSRANRMRTEWFLHDIPHERNAAAALRDGMQLERSKTVSKKLLAKVSTSVDADRAEVWSALTDPEAIKEYMFGTNVSSQWREGSSIVWKGEFKGKAYEDKGKILKIDPEKTLKYSHFSALSGKPDRPENYHTVTIELSDVGESTGLSLTQDNNASEEAREESQRNWAMMLDGLKKYVESRSTH